MNDMKYKYNLKGEIMRELIDLGIVMVRGKKIRVQVRAKGTNVYMVALSNHHIESDSCGQCGVDACPECEYWFLF